MTDHTRRSLRLLGATAVMVALLVPGPAAAQTTDGPEASGRWGATELDAPFDQFEAETRTADPVLTGTLVFDKVTVADQITEARITVIDDPADDFVPVAGCDLPDEIVVPGDGSSSGDVDLLPLEVPLAIECNGRYLVDISATTSRPGEADLAIRRALTLEALPAPVREMTSSFDEAAARVTVTWPPVPDVELSPDTFGYVVERAGPADENGDLGHYDAIRSLDRFDDTRVTNKLEQPGTYSFRVRMARHAPSGDVLSSILQTQSSEVFYAPPPPTTTTTAPTTTSTTGPRIGTAIPTVPNRPPPTFAPPTTADTGFEDLLDYGERPSGTEVIVTEIPELATEDQSAQAVIVDEGGDAPSIFLPVAGALVLFGWLGHIIYINRLAREL